MNYYIQGDAAKADKIKAAFERLGYSTAGWHYNGKCGVYFTNEADKTVDYTHIEPFVTLIKTHPDYKELELSVEPKFKVGDWIVQNDNGTVSQITKVIKDIDEDGEFWGYEHTNGYFSECFENGYHLWTMADVKDGDILSAKIDGDDYILIFKQIKDGWVETYGHYYITIDKFCAPTQMFCRNYQGRLYPAAQKQYRTLFKKMHDDGYEWDFDKKELKKIPVKPKFKVGDWIVHEMSDGKLAPPRQVTDITNKSYILDGGKGGFDTFYFEDLENDYRLWTIGDAKDGDVLYFNDNTIVVFKDLYNSTTFHSYCHIEDGLFEISEDEMPDWWESKGFTPATKEQRDLLFAKMKEVGYQWDVDKKELRKIKSHYDISNFKPFDKVLVRDADYQKWECDMISTCDGNFYCFRGVWEQCIPYNDDTKHLLGTTDMCGEGYINW